MDRAASLPPSVVTLDDKYELDSGRIYLSGLQALVRLPLVQRARDKAAGLNTGGFISGYRGSPLSTYDMALQRARRLLDLNNIRFSPGLNEEMAATAVWGTQQLGLDGRSAVDGVFSIWYGKNPGVDRCGDVFRHANFAGTSRYGGVLAVLGDDHLPHSSTLPNQSEQFMAAMMMPVLYPASLEDFIELGLLGFALSRYSGCWIGFKVVAQTVETSASITTDAVQPVIVTPGDFEAPSRGLNIRRAATTLPGAAEESLQHEARMKAVAAFARANRLNRVIVDARPARLGIVSSGKAYLDVCDALRDLGLGNQLAVKLGVRLYKLGLTWPLEQRGARAFAEGLDEILVVEEKRAFIEDQLAALLYREAGPNRPRIIGKYDEAGRTLLPSYGELTPNLIARVIAERLLRIHGNIPSLQERLERLDSLDRGARQIARLISRPAFFCSGCPHNTSTNLPDGSRAFAGIGCHAMVIALPQRRTLLHHQMGGEGAAWIGQAAFTDEPHVFQNMGDGTYAHSGLLAIRAAVSAGVNITYKILYNDAVAMTGGQPVEGGFSVAQITRQLKAEGVRRIAVVTDDPARDRPDLAEGVSVHGREHLDRVQREFREVAGVTVLIYEQECAAEKRRRRKRGERTDPGVRVFINTDVCEGCGDCSVKSNCVSVEPVETEFGRKRRINQSACNKDYSCVSGFCPSFVTLHGAQVKRAERKHSREHAGIGSDLPLPDIAQVAEETYNILVTGIGGTGVMTVGALIGMAAHMDGKACTVLDSTGMAQKNGSVTSHIRVAAGPEYTHAAAIGIGAAHLLLGCDIVVAADPRNLATVARGVTRAVVNSVVVPTAGFVIDNAIDLREKDMRAQLDAAVGADHVDYLAATNAATSLMGDAIATNLFLLGYAIQKGLLPVTLDSIVRAIKLNGVSVDESLETLAWGRKAAADWKAISDLIPPPPAPPAALTVNELIENRAEALAAYQNRSYADRYRSVMAEIRTAIEGAAGVDQSDFLKSVALNLYKVMAYKDEYEVARLYGSSGFQRALESQFSGNYKLRFHLAVPMLASRDPTTGELRKSQYGSWVRFVFRVLARLKRLRGTPFDIFGYSEERKRERLLIEDYVALMRYLAANLTAQSLAVATALASLPDEIRGFGHVKAKSLQRARQRQSELLLEFERTSRGAAVSDAA